MECISLCITGDRAAHLCDFVMDLTLSVNFSIVSDMSDGPHRSLPLPFYWKGVAERAANHTHSTEHVGEALLAALLRTFGTAPLAELRAILETGDQRSLFSDQIVAQLQAARNAHPGMTATTALIDGAITAVERGLSGSKAVEAALEDAGNAILRSTFRSIEEHYLREEDSGSAAFMRQRLHTTRDQCDPIGAASNLLAEASVSKEALNAPRHSGLEEGPPL